MIMVNVNIPPPPIPSIARKTINMIMLCDTEHPRAPMKNTTSDARRHGLRPKISDKRPYIGCIAYRSAFGHKGFDGGATRQAGRVDLPWM